MWEIISRSLPYSSEEMGPFGRFLKRRIIGGLRPDMSAARPELCNHAYIALMHRAWEQAAAARPTFEEICDVLRPLSALDPHPHQSSES